MKLFICMRFSPFVTIVIDVQMNPFLVSGSLTFTLPCESKHKETRGNKPKPGFFLMKKVTGSWVCDRIKSTGQFGEKRHLPGSEPSYWWRWRTPLAMQTSSGVFQWSFINNLAYLLLHLLQVKYIFTVSTNNNLYKMNFLTEKRQTEVQSTFVYWFLCQTNC